MYEKSKVNDYKYKDKILKSIVRHIGFRNKKKLGCFNFRGKDISWKDVIQKTFI